MRLPWVTFIYSIVQESIYKEATRLHHAGDDHDIAFVFLVEPARLHHAGNDLAAVFIFLIAESRSRQPCRR